VLLRQPAQERWQAARLAQVLPGQQAEQLEQLP
jgi:hypothetical protein